jgi:RHS repeat-associated protein
MGRQPTLNDSESSEFDAQTGNLNWRKNIILNKTKNLSFTPFNKISSISENQNKLQFYYGTDQQRRIMQTRDLSSNALLKEKFYGSQYEKEVDYTTNTTRQWHYISGGDGLAAVYIKTNETGQLYFVAKDHLGSIIGLYNTSGSLVEEYSYDAWGRRRDPVTWAPLTQTPNFLLTRGYTGHEHLDEFGLINMNGRLYDPLLGRMLSPDNYVQDASGTQNFNRYSYCFNNPMLYTDPSGELPWLIPVIIGAVVGAEIGGACADNFVHWAPWDWDQKSWEGALVGAIIGASIGYGWSAAVGPAGGITGNVAGTGKMAWKILGRGLLSSNLDMATAYLNGENDIWVHGVTGLISGTLTRGIDYNRVWTKGFLKNFVVQGAIGAGVDAINMSLSDNLTIDSYDELSTSFLTNGLIGGISGGIKSWYEGRNFWTGEYRQTGGRCSFPIFKQKKRFNPKGVYALSFSIGQEKKWEFTIPLFGLKINSNPTWVNNSYNWPSYWKNAPILFPGMFWFRKL